MQFDSEIKKIEDEFIDFIVSSPLFIGEKLIFSTIKAYFMTRENLTQEELKELSGFSSGAISQELKKLLKRGLIEISNISNTGKMTSEFLLKSI
jgi:DNA-binding transcriptional regulator GbsR (MarR family)